MEHQHKGHAFNILWRLRVLRLQLKRGAFNLSHPTPRLVQDRLGSFPYILATSQTALHTSENPAEYPLELGKIENLRVAARLLNGCVIPANSTFSFWRQLGPPLRARGFVLGRELRQGCLVPSIAGGLCQLSNAIYDCALKAGATIIERHAHSQIIPGSLAEQGRDATVMWNYIDLRFRIDIPIQLSAKLTSSTLEVNFLSKTAHSTTAVTKEKTSLRVLIDEAEHSCMSCNQGSCSIHERRQTATIRAQKPKRAVLVDVTWPEYLRYAADIASCQDSIFTPWGGGGPWPVKHYGAHFSASSHALARSVAVRAARKPASKRAANLHHESLIAQALARQIGFEHDRIIVAQSFLPTLWRSGFLGGRSYAVLMSRHPLRQLHLLLENASKLMPEASELRDFRAAAELVECEAEALAHAESIITPHPEIARLFPKRNELLSWSNPVLPGGDTIASNQQIRGVSGTRIFFPYQPYARKGAPLIRDFAIRTATPFLVVARSRKQRAFWRSCNVEFVSNWREGLPRASQVIAPTVTEDRPVPLLAAQALGISIITTPQSGLLAQPHVKILALEELAAWLRDQDSTLG